MKPFLTLSIILLALSNSQAVNSASLENSLKKVLSQGYFDARIDGEELLKGSLYKIGRVKFNSITSLPSLSLSQYQGQPASRVNADNIVEELKDVLLSSGFIFSFLEFDLEPVPGKHRVNLLISINTGSRFKLGGLVFKGTKTRQKTLERMSMLETGETYNYSRIEQAIKKLSRSGYFSDVYQKILARDSLKNLVYPILNLTDLKVNNISGILGYNNEDNRKGSALNGLVDIKLINLLGTARDFNFHFSARNKEKQIDLEYVEPWLLTLPLGASLNLHLLIEDSVYIESSYGSTLFQDINFNSRYNLSFLRQFNETFFFRDSFTGFRDTVIFTSRKSEAFISGIELIQDFRDRAPNTLSGGYFKVKFNGIRRTEADSVSYLVQNLTESHFWIPISKRFILKTKAASAFSWPLKASLNNRGNLFQVGGAGTIRGYREKEFLTNAYVYSNIELQYLLSTKNRVMILTDPGLVNKRSGDIYWNRVLGYGFGMDLGSKDWVFAIRYALSRERSFANGLLHVKIENRF